MSCLIVLLVALEPRLNKHFNNAVTEIVALQPKRVGIRKPNQAAIWLAFPFAGVK
jgi:hypothetical protein